jgi:hypothetical protein
MKSNLFSVIILLFLPSVTLSPDSLSTNSFSGMSAVESSDKVPQSTQKQKFDYMSSILSRNTKPECLFEKTAESAEYQMGDEI